MKFEELKRVQTLYICTSVVIFKVPSIYYKEGPRDWQNVFAVRNFSYIEFFFIYLTLKLIRHTEDFINIIEVRYIWVPLNKAVYLQRNITILMLGTDC